MSLHPELITWAATRPKWQQEALRRLIDRPRLTRADLAEILDLCKAEYGATESATQRARSIGDGEVTAGTRPADDVTLEQVRDLEHVNALKVGQVLEIAPTGLTVVYGDNGAGKSGYVRVLKQSCRARGGAQPIHSNVYSGDDTPAKATLQYRLGTDTRTFQWTPQADCPPELREVSIFDSRSASVYVTAENDVAYLPQGLDLLPRLVALTDMVCDTLEREIGGLKAQRDHWPDFSAGTTVFEQLQNLHTERSEAAIRALAELTPRDKAALRELRLKDAKYKSANPAGHALARRQCAKRLRDMLRRLSIAEAGLASAKISNLRKAQDSLRSARQAAELAKRVAFKATPNSGIGTEAWQMLWEAARAFVNDASNGDGAFPPPAGQSCPLCLQVVAPDTATQLTAFEQFVKSQVQTAVASEKELYRNKRSALADIAIPRIADSALLSELATLDAALARGLRDHLRILARGQSAALNAKEATDWDALAPLPPSPANELKQLVLRIEKEAEVFETATNLEERKAIESALREYEAREKLSKVLPRVKAQAARERRQAALQRCIRSANTAPITRKNSELLAQAVSQPLADEFDRQLKALRLTHIPITLEATRGEKARALHTLKLGKSATDAVDTDDVLSEGEHRCIALAAFFAEVSLQESKATLVFDDPVSSLDHNRREYVAGRIVALAKDRPVLVFTHDMVFLAMLQASAEQAQIEIARRRFWRSASVAGLVTNDWPWFGVKAKARVGELKQLAVELTKLAATDRPAYESRVGDFYGRLRDTWERAVEDHLLNGAVRRFGTEVKTKSLDKLHLVSEGHIEALRRGMTKTSQWLRGHDQATALGLPVPEPDELAADVSHLQKWIAEMTSLHASG